MALIPRAFRPAAIIRRRALYLGILGPSRVWKVIAVWVFGKATLKKFFGRNPEVIDLAKFGAGRTMSIETVKPITRRRRRKLAKAGTPAPTLKEYRAKAELLAASRSRR